jgi:DNA-binding NarL/FixJ family response regulator
LLADDDSAIRTLVTMFLERDGYAVLAACDGAEALGVFQRRHESIALLLSDVAMPKLNGLQLADAVHRLSPELPVLLISGNIREADRGWGCILKPFTSGELTGRVRQILAENGPGASSHSARGRVGQPAEPLAPFTSRESEVLQLICDGYSSKAIGHKLGIAHRTATCHRTRILQKAGVHETASLVRFACRAGYIEA